MNGFNIDRFKSNMDALIDQMKRGCFFDQNTIHYAQLDLDAMVEDVKYYDQRIDVHNLAYFMRRLDEVFEADESSLYGACYFNISGFRVINEKVGYERGTEILAAFFKNLQDKLGKDECVCCMARDTGLVLFLNGNLQVVMNYLQGVDLAVNGNSKETFSMRAVAGYLETLKDCKDKHDVMEAISLTFSKAKYENHVPLLFCTDKMVSDFEKNKQIEDQFRPALEHDEFSVFYQPKVNLQDYSLTGAEALCRWVHDGKVDLPKAFIPILDLNVGMAELDFYMIEHVCRDIKTWLERGIEPVQVSVNLGKSTIGNPMLLTEILSIVDKYEIPHKYLQIELSEPTADISYSYMKKLVLGLRNSGISTAIDDFGFGYSSLKLIRDMPWNMVKLDKCLLHDVGDKVSEGIATSFLRNIISMIQELGMMCMVGGVETNEDVRLLKECGCLYGQGYYFDKPLSREDFESRLKSV